MVQSGATDRTQQWVWLTQHDREQREREREREMRERMCMYVRERMSEWENQRWWGEIERERDGER